MFNSRVFKCDLLSIKPDIRVNVDNSMRKNIMDADTETVTTILVKESWNPSYFKEIITGLLIPTYRVLTYKTSGALDGTVEKEVPKSPCFIKYNMIVGDEGEVLSSDLVLATADEVKDYLFSHIDTDGYEKKLKEIFTRGINYYNDSKDKGVVSDSLQIKRMLKALKKTKGI